MAFGQKIKTADFILFYRQVALLTGSGLSLAESVQTILEEGDRSPMGKRIALINKEVEAGVTAADAFVKNLPHLSSIPPSMMNHRDTKGGKRLFSEIADYLERKAKMEHFTRRGATYPILLASVTVILMTVVFTFVIPTFEKMFADMGTSLPPPTRWVIEISHLVRTGWPIVLAILALIPFLYNKKRVLFYRLWDKLPLFGVLSRKVALAEFLRRLALLDSFDIPVPEAILSSANSVSNPYFSDKWRVLASTVSSYSQMISEMRSHAIYPCMIIRSLIAGERSCAMGVTLSETAAFLERETTNAYDQLEPLLYTGVMIFMGGVIGFLVLAVYLPIFQLASVM